MSKPLATNEAMIRFGLNKYKVGFVNTGVCYEVLAKNTQSAKSKALNKLQVKIYNAELFCEKIK